MRSPVSRLRDVNPRGVIALARIRLRACRILERLLKDAHRRRRAPIVGKVFGGGGLRRAAIGGAREESAGILIQQRLRCARFPYKRRPVGCDAASVVASAASNGF